MEIVAKYANVVKFRNLGVAPGPSSLHACRFPVDCGCRLHKQSRKSKVMSGKGVYANAQSRFRGT